MSVRDGDKEEVFVDFDNARMVGVINREDLIEMLKKGDVVAIDKTTGKFLPELLGVKLPSADEAIEKVTAKIM